MQDYALFEAAFKNDPVAIELAVNSGIDPNMVHLEGGHTPLIMAAEGPCLDAVLALLRLGAEPNQRIDWKSRVDGRRYNGRTSLMYARSGDVARALISAGAEVNARDENGETALTIAVDKVNPSVVIELLRSGAEIGGRFKVGRKKIDLDELFDLKESQLREIGGEHPNSRVLEALGRLAEIKGLIQQCRSGERPI